MGGYADGFVTTCQYVTFTFLPVLLLILLRWSRCVTGYVTLYVRCVTRLFTVILPHTRCCDPIAVLLRCYVTFVYVTLLRILPSLRIPRCRRSFTVVRVRSYVYLRVRYICCRCYVTLGYVCRHTLFNDPSHILPVRCYVGVSILQVHLLTIPCCVVIQVWITGLRVTGSGCVCIHRFCTRTDLVAVSPHVRVRRTPSPHRAPVYARLGFCVCAAAAPGFSRCRIHCVLYGCVCGFWIACRLYSFLLLVATHLSLVGSGFHTTHVAAVLVSLLYVLRSFPRFTPRGAFGYTATPRSIC